MGKLFVVVVEAGVDVVLLALLGKDDGWVSEWHSSVNRQEQTASSHRSRALLDSRRSPIVRAKYWIERVWIK
ncbi:hypothetical protein H6F95_13030 [Cyanobacteria bacterium FACHB-471]|nr:hypothetical protein [Cyanobacteria bacterium FACHB-471]